MPAMAGASHEHLVHQLLYLVHLVHQLLCVLMLLVDLDRGQRDRVRNLQLVDLDRRQHDQVRSTIKFVDLD